MFLTLSLPVVAACVPTECPDIVWGNVLKAAPHWSCCICAALCGDCVVPEHAPTAAILWQRLRVCVCFKSCGSSFLRLVCAQWQQKWL